MTTGSRPRYANPARICDSCSVAARRGNRDADATPKAQVLDGPPIVTRVPRRCFGAGPSPHGARPRTRTRACQCGGRPDPRRSDRCRSAPRSWRITQDTSDRARECASCDRERSSRKPTPRWNRSEREVSGSKTGARARSSNAQKRDRACALLPRNYSRFCAMLSVAVLREVTLNQQVRSLRDWPDFDAASS